MGVVVVFLEEGIVPCKWPCSRGDFGVIEVTMFGSFKPVGHWLVLGVVDIWVNENLQLFICVLRRTFQQSLVYEVVNISVSSGKLVAINIL